MPLTMAEIRAKYPDPIRFCDFPASLQSRQDAEGPPPCYCVGGAFLMATGKSWWEDEPDGHGTVLPDAEILFPGEFTWSLGRANAKLLLRAPDMPPFWADGNTDMAAVYESAIQGSNDQERLILGAYAPCREHQDHVPVPDHFELAWQLLDDALTYDPATFDAARELRLLKGGLMKIGTDRDYFDAERPELVAYRARLLARYLELSSTTPP